MACLVVKQFLVYLPKRSSSCFKLERTMLFSVVKNNKFNISIFPCTFNKKKPFSTSVSFVEFCGGSQGGIFWRDFTVSGKLMAGKQWKKSNSERQQISHRYLSLKPLPNSSVVAYKESSTKR